MSNFSSLFFKVRLSGACLGSLPPSKISNLCCIMHRAPLSPQTLHNADSFPHGRWTNAGCILKYWLVLNSRMWLLNPEAVFSKCGKSAGKYSNPWVNAMCLFSYLYMLIRQGKAHDGVTTVLRFNGSHYGFSKLIDFHIQIFHKSWMGWTKPGLMFGKRLSIAEKTKARDMHLSLKHTPHTHSSLTQDSETSSYSYSLLF